MPWAQSVAIIGIDPRDLDWCNVWAGLVGGTDDEQFFLVGKLDNSNIVDLDRFGQYIYGWPEAVKVRQCFPFEGSGTLGKSMTESESLFKSDMCEIHMQLVGI